MLVPLYGFMHGDTVGLLVLVQDSDAISDVAACLLQAASVRVDPARATSVFYKGRRLDPTLTVQQAGLSMLERIDVVPEVV